MSLLDTASLIVTPNGYKEGKLFSVIPSDGSGDMSVTRATTATRVNSAGLVELVPYNLLTYSEQIDNVAWTALNCTITVNNVVSPSGIQNADTAVTTANNSFLGRTVSISSDGSTYTQSIFVKWVSGYELFKFRTALTGGTAVAKESVFNLKTGAYISGDTTYDIEDYGNGWFRFSHQITNNSTNTTYNYQIFNTNDSTQTQSASFWGAQLVEGSTAKDYQKTETRLNIPRLDYSNGTCPSLLVEPQRTNLLTYSSSFDNAAWTKVPLGGTALTTVVTANDTISPSGIQDADKIFMSLGGGTTTSDWARLQSQTFNQTSGTSYTISFWAWASQSSEVGKIVRVGIGGNTALLDFTLTATATRFIVTYTAAATGTDSLLFQLRGAQGLASTAEFYLWGAQLEVGSYATSYIPTTSASVTRNADVISKTGISSLIGQTEGTLFVDLEDFIELDIPCLTIDNGTNDNRIVFYREFGTGYLGLFIAASGTTVVALSTTSASNGKIAIAYTGTTFVMYRNGVQILTTTSAIPSSMSAVRFNGRATNDFYTNRKIKSFALWQTRLDNATLASLTTL